MNVDDLLYDKVIGAEGSIRHETKQVTDHISIDYEITVSNGEEYATVKQITVTSRGQYKVVVDDKTIVEPTPTSIDEDCYY